MTGELYLISNGFQPEYEVGFANAACESTFSVTLIGSDSTLYTRLNHKCSFSNLRGSQTQSRTKVDKAFNLIRYFFRYGLIALKKREAVFHFNGLFCFKTGFPALIEAFFDRIVCRTFWLTVHNILPHDAEGWVNRLCFRHIYKMPDKLIVHTEDMRRRLVFEYGVKNNKIIVIEHGIDKFHYPDANLRNEFRFNNGIQQSSTVLLAFGNVSPYKGTDELIDALSLIKNPSRITLIIAGKASSKE